MQEKNWLTSQVPRFEQHAVRAGHFSGAFLQKIFVTEVVHSATCGAQRSGAGAGLCCFFFFRRFFLASTVKGAVRAAATPAAPRVKSDRRGVTPAAAFRAKLSNEKG